MKRKDVARWLMVSVLAVVGSVAAEAANLTAVGDTLVGVLMDAKSHAIRSASVKLEGSPSASVTTDRMGVFTIPAADLNGKLRIVAGKKAKAEQEVAVEGYPYLVVTVDGDKVSVGRSYEPSETLKLIRQREANRRKSSNIITREDIAQAGYADISDALRQMNGISYSNGSIRIRSSVSINSPTDPLVVVDGVPCDVGVISTIAIKDVSMIQVLKDGSEYGVRGANGVIVIKTGD